MKCFTHGSYEVISRASVLPILISMSLSMSWLALAAEVYCQIIELKRKASTIGAEFAKRWSAKEFGGTNFPRKCVHFIVQIMVGNGGREAAVSKGL